MSTMEKKYMGVTQTVGREVVTGTRGPNIMANFLNDIDGQNANGLSHCHLCGAKASPYQQSLLRLVAGCQHLCLDFKCSF